MRVGDTVRRRAGPWTPAVHALLRYLEAAGFEAPRVRGIDERGREILGYIPGEAYAGAENPVPDRVLDEEHLDAAMKELEAGGELAKRIVGFGTGTLPLGPMGPMRPAGFPTTIEVRRAP